MTVTVLGILASSRTTTGQASGTRAAGSISSNYDGTFSAGVVTARGENGDFFQGGYGTSTGAVTSKTEVANGKSRLLISGAYTDSLGGAFSSDTTSTRSASFQESGAYSRSPGGTSSGANFQQTLSTTSRTSDSASRGYNAPQSKGTQYHTGSSSETYQYSESGAYSTLPTGTHRNAGFHSVFDAESLGVDVDLGTHQGSRTGTFVETALNKVSATRFEIGSYTNDRGVIDRQAGYTHKVKGSGAGGGYESYTEHESPPGMKITSTVTANHAYGSTWRFSDVGTYTSSGSGVATHDSRAEREEELSTDATTTVKRTLTTTPGNGNVATRVEEVYGNNSYSEDSHYVHDASGKTTTGSFDRLDWSDTHISHTAHGSASYTTANNHIAANLAVHTTTTVQGTTDHDETGLRIFSYLEEGSFINRTKSATWFSEYDDYSGHATLKEHGDYTQTGSTVQGSLTNTHSGSGRWDRTDKPKTSNVSEMTGRYTSVDGRMTDRSAAFVRDDSTTSTFVLHEDGSSTATAWFAPSDSDGLMPRLWNQVPGVWNSSTGFFRASRLGGWRPSEYNPNGRQETVTSNYVFDETGEQDERSYREWGSVTLQGGLMAENGKFVETSIYEETGTQGSTLTGSYNFGGGGVTDGGHRRIEENAEPSTWSSYSAQGTFSPLSYAASTSPSPSGTVTPTWPLAARSIQAEFSHNAIASTDDGTTLRTFGTSYTGGAVTAHSTLAAHSTFSSYFEYREEGTYVVAFFAPRS